MAETPQDLFVAGAEAKAAELGERHGLTMLSAGLRHLLTARGYDFSEQEAANAVHNHHVGPFWDQAAKPETLDLNHLARAVDLMWSRQPEVAWDLRAVLEGRATSGVGFYGVPQLDWIEREVATELKKRKIRRGTKKYDEFVVANRERVRGAATEVVRGAVERQKKMITGRLEQLNRDRDSWVARAGGIERQLAFRRALLDVAGESPDPRSEISVAAWRDLYARAVTAVDGSINYLQVTYAELDGGIEQGTNEALQRSKELAPFAGALCGCEE